MNSFFVSRNFIQKIEKSITSTNKTSEKIIVTSFAINAFTSFRLIHRELKNITSSTVFAFITTKTINAHQSINHINAIAHIKARTCHEVVFCILFVFNSVLIYICSQS